MTATIQRSGFPPSLDAPLVGLRHLVECLDGLRIPVEAQYRRPGNIPYWGAGTIQDYVDDYIFDEPLILLGEDGAPFDDATRSVAHYSEGQIWVNNHMHVLRARGGVNPKYLCYALNCVRYTEFLSGAIIPKLTQSQMMEIRVPQPTAEKQDSIANFLDEQTATIDRLIEKQKSLIASTELRLTEWREREFWGRATSNPFDAPPVGWSKMSNRHLFTHMDSRSETGNEELLSVSHITGVTPRSMKQVNMFEAESTVGYKRVQPGQLVINTMWAWMGALGVSEYEGIVSPAYDVYDFRSTTELNRQYFDIAYRTQTYANLMKVHSRGIWESRLRLYPEIFMRLPALIPPLDVQNRLVAENEVRTRRTRNLVMASERLISLLEERRSALVTAAVTGQIEV